MDYFTERGTNIIADPVHKYIEFTVPRYPKEITEKDLFDNEWLQRLKWIHQLQCAIWVFPGAEHSRFMHSLGSMHIASRFAKQLYPSLQETIKRAPTLPYVEETLRLAALLHDIGHGPFGHSFDHCYLLKKYGITHEDIGQMIITEKLNKIIENIYRSPSGEFRKKIVPEYLAYLIKKPSRRDGRNKYPKWLQLLRPLFSGSFTVDNLDYIMRDSLMCGISTEPIDLERIIYYTAINKEGLVLHKSGLGALIGFFETKNFLYTRVYFHRTVRSFELHLYEIFKETIEKIFNSHPKDKDFLDKYLHLTDLSLLGKVSSWVKAKKEPVKNEAPAKKKTVKKEPITKKKDVEEKRLIVEWEKLLRRRKKWRFVCGTTEEQYRISRLSRTYKPAEFECKIKKAAKLPSNIDIKIEMARYDNRPFSPLAIRKSRVSIYDPGKDKISSGNFKEILDRFPLKTITCFLFINKKTKRYDRTIIKAFEKIVGRVEEELPTNI